MRTTQQARALSRLIVIVSLAVLAAMLALAAPAARQGYASPDASPGSATADGPLTGVSIEGPGQGGLNAAQVFSATVEPLTATTPITYVWEATGQTPVTHTTSSPTDETSFSWNAIGTKVITVTASNLDGFAIATRTVSVVVIAPESVAVAGPITGIMNIAQVFTATVAPLTTTTPITYVWDATGQTAVTHTASGPTDTASFAWNAIGPQLITVTALNEGAAVSATHAITIAAPNPAPILASISPTMAIASGPAFTLTVTGSAFVDGAIVRWNSSDRATTFISSTQLLAWIPDSDLRGGSPAKVSVFNPPPGGGESGTQDFVIRHYLYLPQVMQRWPPIPDVPVLYAISNPSHDPAYSVNWNAAFLADSYTLQEDTNALFPAPVTVYAGTGTFWNAGAKSPGTYYYRVRAFNGYGDSGWSSVQSTVVWPPLPAAPTLNAISNPDYDENYQITWSMVTYGDSYTLEEDDNPSFTSPVIAYAGTSAAWTASAIPAGTHYYRVKASNVRGDSGWSGTQSVVVLPGIHGHVTYNGSPVAGVSLALRFYNGSSWSTYATASTAANGRYVFNSAPSLAAGQRLYVRYLNTTDPARLVLWQTMSLLAYSPGTSVGIGDFDVANITLVSPGPGATVALPATFWWVRRPNTPSDSYELHLFTPSGGPSAYTNPLGYVSVVTVNSLPAGFYPNVQYGWYVSVWSPDAGYGVSYYYHPIKFSNTGLSPNEMPLFRHGPERDDWQPPSVEQAVP